MEVRPMLVIYKPISIQLIFLDLFNLKNSAFKLTILVLSLVEQFQF